MDNTNVAGDQIAVQPIPQWVSMDPAKLTEQELKIDFLVEKSTPREQVHRFKMLALYRRRRYERRACRQPVRRCSRIVRRQRTARRTVKTTCSSGDPEPESAPSIIDCFALLQMQNIGTLDCRGAS